jgi:fermentation-respiration switch protein FrsA (DUF1100 family)
VAHTDAWAQFDPAVLPKIWTSKFLDLVKLSDQIQSCPYADAAISSILPVAEAIQLSALGPTGLINTTLLHYQQERSAGVGAIAKAPMLVVQSTADTIVPYSMVNLAFNDTCKAGGEPIELSVYSVLDHAEMPAASAPEWLHWLEARFAGDPRVCACTVRQREPLNAADAFQGANI